MCPSALSLLLCATAIADILVYNIHVESVQYIIAWIYDTRRLFTMT